MLVVLPPPRGGEGEVGAGWGYSLAGCMGVSYPCQAGWATPHQAEWGYPPLADWMGVPLPVIKHTPVKTVPSRGTTYAGGNNIFASVMPQCNHCRGVRAKETNLNDRTDHTE